MTAADRTALVRYAEQMLLNEKRFINDQYIESPMNPALVRRTREDPDWFSRIWSQYKEQYQWFANTVLARAQFFDDQLSEAINAGAAQVVLYGSGMDTRAFRLLRLTPPTIIIEIDREEIIQETKKRIRERFADFLMLSVPCDGPEQR